MNRFIALFLASLCCACSSTDSDSGRIASILFDYVRGTSPRVTRDQAAAVPYATMGLTIGSGPQGLLVLGTLTPEQAEWYAGERVFVSTTRRGQIVRTVGLPYDLGGLRTESALGGTSESAGRTFSPARLTFDFPDLGIYGAPAQCSMSDAGNANVEILGASLPTRHIVQHCDVPVLKWSFDNDFWEDPNSGLVWRSSQHIHPKSPAIILEVLRPVQDGGAG